MSQEQGNHSVAPRYPWVGKTMEGVTPWESLRAPVTRGSVKEKRKVAPRP